MKKEKYRIMRKGRSYMPQLKIMWFWIDLVKIPYDNEERAMEFIDWHIKIKTEKWEQIWPQ